MDHSLTQFVDEVLASHDFDRGQVIAIMQDIQAKFRYLPADCLRYAAEKLGMSAADIYGVATFYSQFALEPRGEYVIGVCLGTACYVKGSSNVLERVCRELDTKVGKTTSDGLFTIKDTRCLGACGLAPVMMINDEVYGNLTPDKIPGILAKYRNA